MIKRIFKFNLIVIVFLLDSGHVVVPCLAANASRPNFLLIISDDQRYDTMEFMPLTKARIFEQGITFSNGFVTTPLCCPSRASIFTGMYAHNHGVRLNLDSLLQKTFAERLHESGYYTALVGKYLNSWGGSARPEFDFWAAFADGGAPYFRPTLNVNGVWNVHPGYITHILRDYALEFLHRAAAQEKPFLLIFAPNAPHAPALPAPGDEALYSDLSAYNPPHFNEVDVADKPAWVQALPLLTAEQIAEIQNFRLRQLQSLHALDQAIDSLLNLLAEQNQLDNTFVLYLSDNGYLLGDHRIYDKNFVYEESIHVPFALRYLPLVSEPRLETKLVANIDIAPTIYELAGIPIPHEVDGRSLVPVMIGQSEWRDALLIESWPGRAPYAAVHTENFVYVESDGDRSELYDLMNDPYQLNNQIDNPTYASVIDSLKQRLQELRGNISSVSEFDPFVLQEFILFQNYPNPFNPETSIRFSVPQRSHVSLKIFDVLGKEVATPVNGELDPGLHSVVFDARGLASGLYFYRLLTTSSAYTKSMLLVK